MTTNFYNYAAVAATTLDAVFGDIVGFNVQPMALIGGKWIADSSRSAVLGVTAILTQNVALDEPRGRRGGSNVTNMVAEHATTASLIEIAKAATPYALRNKDRMMRVADGVIFEISAVEATEFDHVTFRVVRLGVST
jgi:hypothetical protein